ncbi:Por secretion system C-terminal sorting domain-containing protein [Candidatus Kryptobacter tengchongensis]|nr:Por secretion system C-terminal sorting domain-containing protein [Candidatus Kryptobacter tengchongensis]
MRWLIFLSILVFIFTISVYSQGFRVKSSYPNNGDYSVPSLPTPVLIKFVFSDQVDVNRNFGEAGPFLPFLSFLAFDPRDSIQFVQPYVPLRTDTIGAWFTLAPNTDYCIILFGAYSITGIMLEKPYVVNFTTASTIGQRSVRGTITPPSPRISSFTGISQFNVPNLKVDLSKTIGQILSQGNEVKILKKSNSLSFDLKLQDLNPFKFLSVDPNVGVVALLDGNPLAQEDVNVKYAANVNSDFSFEIRYVRDGTYYLFAAFDTQRDGLFNPIGDLLMFYDANGDDQPDPITVSGGDVSGLNLSGVFQIRPFTVKQILDTVTVLAKSYASDVRLRGIQTFEGIEVPGDTLDGKVYSATYIFYSPSKDKYVSVWANAFMGLSLDTVSTPPRPLVDLPTRFIDSDVVFDSAEANGGYAFRNEPNTITSVMYDLRNYSGDDFDPPDTVNPYWRIVYFKTDTSFNLRGFLAVYLNPSDGRLVKKFEISFKPVTAKEKFEVVDNLAMNRANDAQLVYVLGFEDDDTLVDGKCLIWNYGYKSNSVGKFSVWVSLGLAWVDTSFFDISDLTPLNKPLQLMNYKDSDTLAAVAEANGGSAFRNLYQYTGGGYLYSQSIDTTKIYFHAIYNGIDVTTGREKALIVFIDPVTGNFVGTFTKVEKDETVGIPASFTLYQNYPNPFNPTTTITYDIPMRANVKLIVYNVLGQEVAILVNELQEAGRYNVKFDASGLPSGVYFYKLEAGRYVDVKKMMLVK